MLRRLFYLAGVALALFAAVIVVQAGLDALHSGLVLVSSKGPGQVLFYLMMLAGLYGFVRFVWRPVGMNATWDAYKSPNNRSRFWRGFFAGLGLGSLVMVAGFALLLVIGGATANLSTLANLRTGDCVTTGIAACVVPVLVMSEELIFRAIVYNYLRGHGKQNRLTVASAIVVAAFLFAVAHGAQWQFAWTTGDRPALFVGLFILGVTITLAYEVSGSLAFGAGIHCAVIYAKILPDRLHFIALDQTHYRYTGVHNDPRTGAYIWLLFVLLAVLTWVGRRRLHALAAVEPEK